MLKTMSRIAAVAAALFSAGAATAEPLVLARNGSFFVGGKMTEIDGRAMMTGHM